MNSVWLLVNIQSAQVAHIWPAPTHANPQEMLLRPDAKPAGLFHLRIT